MAASSIPATTPLPHVSLIRSIGWSHSEISTIESQIRAASSAETSLRVTSAPSTSKMKHPGSTKVMVADKSTKVMVADKSKAHASLGLIFQDLPPRMYSSSSSILRRKKETGLLAAAVMPLATVAGPMVDAALSKGLVTVAEDSSPAANEQMRSNDPDAFTSEQDATILKLKGKGKTWANIGAEVGKTKGQVQGRFKELTKGGGVDVVSGEAAKKGNPPGERDKHGRASADASGDKTSKYKQTQAGESQKKTKDRGGSKKEPEQWHQTVVEKEKQKPAGEDNNDVDKSKAATNKGRKVAKLKADDLFSIDDLRVLAEEKLKDDDGCWLRLASRLYDRTGKRVHPDQIFAKFERR